jgi:hypothetical protein
MLTRTSFIDTLAKTKSVAEHYAFIESSAARGDIDTLKYLFIQAFQCSFGHSDWAPRAVCEKIVEILASTAGYDNALASIELAQSVSGQGLSRHLRLTAVISKLVAKQSATVIDRLLDNKVGLESCALILHEAVIRGRLIPGSHAVQQSAQRLASHGHPLSILPRTPLEIEADLFTMQWTVTSDPFDPSTVGTSNNEVADGSGSIQELVTETTTHDRAMGICAAVKNWQDESNGMMEARTFVMHDAKMLGEISRILVMLGLECIGPSGKTVFYRDDSARNVFNDLYIAASMGGAYNNGEFGAYGRLRAWQSLSALMNCEEHTKITDIALRASDCNWYRFGSSNDWFYRVMWDIGIACVIPHKNEIAILAATDTD